MMRPSIFPMRSLHTRPAFWGVDRDLKEVIDSMESTWMGSSPLNSVNTEFKETDQTYFMSIDMPGVNKTKLDIQIVDDQIVIQGTRKKLMLEGNENENEQKITQRVLIPKHVDRDKIQAHCEDGVLYLALPKLEKVQPKKIAITSNES